MKETKINSSMKKVWTRKRQLLLENGGYGEGPVALYLDTRGSARFVFIVPQYVKDLLGLPDMLVGAETADKAESEYNKLVQQWVAFKRNEIRKPVILITVEYRGTDANGKYLAHKDNYPYGGERDVTYLRLSYRLGFDVGGALFDSNPNDPSKVGSRMGYIYGGKVLPYSEELHGQLDRIVAALNQAVQKLHEVMTAEDLHAALMRLGSSGQLLLR